MGVRRSLEFPKNIVSGSPTSHSVPFDEWGGGDDETRVSVPGERESAAAAGFFWPDF